MADPAILDFELLFAGSKLVRFVPSLIEAGTDFVSKNNDARFRHDVTLYTTARSTKLANARWRASWHRMKRSDRLWECQAGICVVHLMNLSHAKKRVNDRSGVSEAVSTSASPFHIEAGEFSLFEILISWVEEVGEYALKNLVQGHMSLS